VRGRRGREEGARAREGARGREGARERGAGLGRRREGVRGRRERARGARGLRERGGPAGNRVVGGARGRREGGSGSPPLRPFHSSSFHLLPPFLGQGEAELGVLSPAHAGRLRAVEDVEEHVAEQLKLALEEEGYLAVGDAGEELLPRGRVSCGMAPLRMG
jgi:hypothetical protein